MYQQKRSKHEGYVTGEELSKRGDSPPEVIPEQQKERIENRKGSRLWFCYSTDWQTQGWAGGEHRSSPGTVSLSFFLRKWSSWISKGSMLYGRSNLCRYNDSRFSQPQTTIKMPCFYAVKCGLKGKNLSSLVTSWGDSWIMNNATII